MLPASAAGTPRCLPPCPRGWLPAAGGRAPVVSGTQARVRRVTSLPMEGGPRRGPRCTARATPQPRVLPSCGPYAWCPQVCPPSCPHQHHPLPPWHSCRLAREWAAASPGAGIKAPVAYRWGDAGAALTPQGDPRGLGTCPCRGPPSPCAFAGGSSPKRVGAPCRAPVLRPLRPPQPGRGPQPPGSLQHRAIEPRALLVAGRKAIAPPGHPTERQEECVPLAPLG